MLNSILHTGSFSIETVAVTLATALILGVIVALVYRSSHVHTSSFAVALAVFPMIEATIIMTVNGNIGTSVALLGAFGLIRFRSAPGSAWDIGFVFFSMAVGLVVGLGFLTLAAVMTVLVGGVMFLLERLRFGVTVPKEKQLRITIPENLEYNGIFDDLFKSYTNGARLERVKTTNMGTMFELTYMLQMKDVLKEKEFIDALRCRNGNLTVVLGTVMRNRDDL